MAGNKCKTAGCEERCNVKVQAGGHCQQREGKRGLEKAQAREVKCKAVVMRDLASRPEKPKRAEGGARPGKVGKGLVPKQQGRTGTIRGRRPQWGGESGDQDGKRGASVAPADRGPPTGPGVEDEKGVRGQNCEKVGKKAEPKKPREAGGGANA